MLLSVGPDEEAVKTAIAYLTQTPDVIAQEVGNYA